MENAETVIIGFEDQQELGAIDREILAKNQDVQIENNFTFKIIFTSVRPFFSKEDLKEGVIPVAASHFILTIQYSLET